MNHGVGVQNNISKTPMNYNHRLKIEKNRFSVSNLKDSDVYAYGERCPSLVPQSKRYKIRLKKRFR